MIILSESESFIESQNIFSACLITGTDKLLNGFANGDCIFLDFSYNIFAVADATERYPYASRNLILSLKDKMYKNNIPIEPHVFKDIIENIWSKQPYTQRCTFSSILIDKTSVSIIHGGDSKVIIADSKNKNIIYKTQSNMNFAGRSKTVPEMINLMLTGENIFIILATDGLFDIIGDEKTKTLNWLLNFPVHEMAEKLKQILFMDIKKEHDDIGFISIDPFKLA